MIASTMWSRFTRWIRRPDVRAPLIVAAGTRLAVFIVAALALQLGRVEAPRFLLHGGQPHPGADLQHALARPRAEVAAEEERARLGRLRPVADAEHAVAIVEEEEALVVAHARLRPAACA